MHAILVLGATGVVGRGVVRAALEAGRPVLAAARDEGALATLSAAHPGADLTVVPGSVADDADSARLAGRILALGRPLAGVVAAIAGPPVRGRLLDQPVARLCQGIHDDVCPHLAAARALLPLLAQCGRGGSYVLVGGPGSALPWSGYGHRSIAAAALRMLAQVLHDEALPLGVRVQLLSVEAPVAQGRHACAQWPTAEAIGRRALALVDRSEAVPVQPVVGAAAEHVAEEAISTLTFPSLEGRRSASPSPAGDTHTTFEDARALLRRLATFPDPDRGAPA
jgi:NAD(P)-dependent dehydrogenase (short-subunit alcohol dehydrogenase family)